jgi:hypothetical protein
VSEADRQPGEMIVIEEENVATQGTAVEVVATEDVTAEIVTVGEEAEVVTVAIRETAEEDLRPVTIAMIGTTEELVAVARIAVTAEIRHEAQAAIEGTIGAVLAEIGGTTIGKTVGTKGGVMTVDVMIEDAKTARIDGAMIGPATTGATKAEEIRKDGTIGARNEEKGTKKLGKIRAAKLSRPTKRWKSTRTRAIPPDTT